jgi:alkaline phosphatase
MTDAEIRQTVADYYGITDLTDAEVNTIRTNYNPGSMDYVLGPMLSSRSIIGWTTSGHTGEDVTLYSYGPNRPVGLFENTDIAHVIEASLCLNLDRTTDRIFVEASTAFAAMGATVKVDATDPNNKVLVVEKVGRPTMYLPLSKDVAKIDGKVYNLSGVTITSPKSGKTYVSQDALALFAGKCMCYGITGYATWDGTNLASA